LIQNRKLIIISVIIFLLLFPALNSVKADEGANILVKAFRLGLLNQRFNQYVEFEFNTSLINESLRVDQSLNLPITLKYWTSIPDSLKTKGVWGFGILRFIPFFMFRNKIIYGMGMPQQFIQLNITSKPSWLECYFTKNRFPIDFTTYNDSNNDRGSFLFPQQKRGNPGFAKECSDDNKSILRTSLIISPLAEAPAQEYTIDIEVYLAPHGMITKGVYKESITFTPSFFPKIDFSVKKPVQLITPQQPVNYPIQVTNTANKKIKVFPVFNNFSSFHGDMNPEFLILNANESSQFSFSKFTEKDFGWHDTTKKYPLNFYVMLAPFTDNETYGPYSVNVTLNTYGFSTPGFESYFLLISFCLILFIMRVWGRKE